MLFLIVSCIVLQKGYCQVTVTNPYQEISLMKDARIYAEAAMKLDFKVRINYTYPKLIDDQGGRDSVLNFLIKGAKEMKAKGFVFVVENITLEKPTQEVLIGGVLCTIIPEDLIFSLNGYRYEESLFIIALSEDNGGHWTFGDSSDFGRLCYLLPGLKRLPRPQYTQKELPQLPHKSF